MTGEKGPYSLLGALWAMCALCALLLLAGCGGQPPRVSRPSVSAMPCGPGSVVQKRDGAYYKDDGPADEIPGNLDSIPDAQPRLEPLHRFANRPYVVLGKSYVPDTTLKPMRQRGVASWYGRKFHGQKTAIGERYDMFAMTAAHPTLALPSYARVTHLGSGKSVVVRVIDRGPFHAGRIIDLSYAAACRLGYINDGSAQVEVQSLLPTESSPPFHAKVRMPAPSVRPVGDKTQHREFELFIARSVSEAAPPDTAENTGPASAAGGFRNIFLQLGAFSSADNAESLRSRLASELDWLTGEIQIQTGDDGIRRVWLGPYTDRGDAEAAAERIHDALGFRPAFVTR